LAVLDGVQVVLAVLDSVRVVLVVPNGVQLPFFPLGGIFSLANIGDILLF